jgi:hypothetical protein
MDTLRPSLMMSGQPLLKRICYPLTPCPGANLAIARSAAVDLKPTFMGWLSGHSLYRHR